MRYLNKKDFCNLTLYKKINQFNLYESEFMSEIIKKLDDLSINEEDESVLELIKEDFMVNVGNGIISEIMELSAWYKQFVYKMTTDTIYSAEVIKKFKRLVTYLMLGEPIIESDYEDFYLDSYYYDLHFLIGYDVKPDVESVIEYLMPSELHSYHDVTGDSVTDLNDDIVRNYVISRYSPIHTDEYYEQKQKELATVYDMNMRYFESLSKSDFEMRVNKMIDSIYPIDKYTSTFPLLGFKGYLIMIFDEYKQVFIAGIDNTNDTDNYLSNPFDIVTNNKFLETLLCNGIEFNSLLFDDFGYEDVTRIYVHITDKLDDSMYEFITGFFDKKYLCDSRHLIKI